MSKKTERIFGIHAVEQVIDKSPEIIINVWMQQNLESDSARALSKKIKKLDIPVQSVNRATLDKMTKGQRHQGIMIEVKATVTKTETDLESVISAAENGNPLYLVLDSVQDPHNLGACIRTAVAAGVTAVIIPRDRAASINETVRKVASGAVESITIVTVVNLVRAIKQLKEAGVWVVGTAGESTTSIYDLDLSIPTAIVMGGEDKGMRSSTRGECDYIASIPIQGDIESLNVSVATGVALFEVVRQRKNS